MKVLILGINYAPEKVGIAIYTAGMAEALAQHGHEVRVVAAQPYYPAWKIMEGFNSLAYRTTREDGVRVTRVPHYIPANPTGARRLLHHVSFGLAASIPALWQGLFWRPDVVVAVAPSLISAPLGRIAAFLAGARSWLHIQDFEVEAAFATGLLKAGGLRSRFASWFERTVLKSFDTVSTISPQMCRKLAEKGVAADRIVEFRNWADLESVRPMAEASAYREEWQIATPHVALYSGNIANKQGIEIVVEAAQLLADRKDLTFVVCGEGPNRENLEARAVGLSNIQFHDLQPRERLHDLMGLATIHLLPQMAGAADLVLPSKLTNMLASGRPVVATAADRTGLAAEVDGCGIRCEPGDAAAFASGIEALLDDGDTWADLSRAARRRAQERWHKDAILGGFEKHLVELADLQPARPVTGGTK